jgi:xylan 1,4-beta-xylosidase
MEKQVKAWATGLAACAVLNLAFAPPAHAQITFPVTIEVDAARSAGELRPIWRFFGADEPNYATMRDGRQLVAELGELRPNQIYFRAHNLLTTGDGAAFPKWGSTNAYTEDANGRPVYDWTILDRIFDTYRARGVRPYVEIGFMPKALSVMPEPYESPWRLGFDYAAITAGWAFPPDDYRAWGELVHQWVLHCIERYGREEVETWYWQTWNEANLPFYWRGTPEEFHRLHDYAIDGVRRALPNARVGGPDVAGHGGEFMRRFIDHVTRGTNYATGQIGTPTDFISFHAKGAPDFVDGHIRMGIAAQLATIDAGFGMIAAEPNLRDKPVIIGESDPEGCAACQGPRFSYRNGTVYSSYTAASFARIHELANRHHVNLEGALTWAFTFENQPYFAGYRQLASNGIDLPVLNVFRMFAQMPERRVLATSSNQAPLDEIVAHGVRAGPDVGVLASRGERRIAILVWHYHDDDVAGPAAAVTLHLRGLGGAFRRGVTLTHYRIDAEHSNAFEYWNRMGAPPHPNEAQYAELREAGQLASLNAPTQVRVSRAMAELSFSLPRQGVSLLILTPAA